MKRLQAVFGVAVLCAFFATLTRAQMGLDFLKKTALSSVFHPVVGSGAVYDNADAAAGSPKHSIELSIVGKELIGAQEGYWLEMSFTEKQAVVYSKMLLSKDDFQTHKIIFQLNGMPAMEMPSNLNTNMRDEMSKWAQAGTETVTVPAGTFSCTHWKKNDGKAEIWTSDKIVPFGMAKSVETGSTTVLVRQITDAKDRITGPVQPFNPQAFAQIMQNQHQ